MTSTCPTFTALSLDHFPKLSHVDANCWQAEHHGAKLRDRKKGRVICVQKCVCVCVCACVCVCVCVYANKRCMCILRVYVCNYQRHWANERPEGCNFYHSSNIPALQLGKNSLFFFSFFFFSRARSRGSTHIHRRGYPAQHTAPGDITTQLTNTPISA